jgi:hypothetical protein
VVPILSQFNAAHTLIIIIGKTALFEPYPFLEDSARFIHYWGLDHVVFTSLDFATVIFFTKKGHQPCAQPPILENQVCVFISPSDGVAQLYPQALGSLFVAFYDSQGYGGGILTLSLLCLSFVAYMCSDIKK